MNQNRSTLIIGAVLIVAGVLFLLGQTVGFLDWEGTWPLIIIAVGGAFFVGMVLGGKATGGLAIPGSILTMIGLILLVQSQFGWWEAWAYAWGLIICSVGIGIYIHGAWSDKPELRKNGADVARTGLILFLVFGAIFGLIFSFTGIAGEGSQLFWSALLIVLGLIQLGARIFRLIRHTDEDLKKDNDLFGPFFLIAIGLCAGLYFLELVTSAELLNLLNLWPLLLVFAGIQLIFGRRRVWISGLLGLLFIATILVVLLGGSQLGLTTRSWWTPSLNTFIHGPITEQVTGSGISAQETRQVSGFDAISLESIGALEVTQGDTESLVIEADDNILPYIETTVQGNTLVIDTKRGIGLNVKTPIRYILTVKNLEEVNLSGAGSLVTAALSGDSLSLEASGAGNFQTGGLQFERLDVSITGAGSVTASGTVTRLDVEITGAGSFNGGDLQTAEANIQISGAGKATVWATETLDTEISGIGGISYYGSPSVTKENSGLGVVTSLGDK